MPPRDHAVLSASGSKRWMTCPGSVRLENFFEDEGSAYAEEGTKAHGVAEARLRAALGLQSPEGATAEQPTEASVGEEMWTFAGQYVQYCTEILETMQRNGHTVRAYIEQRVCFDRWVPEGFGTVDFCAVGGNDLHIVDFKYGKGVPVSATDNSQMRAYALGFLQEMECIYDNLQTVTTHIVQPRINNISSETMKVADLLDWAKKELKPKADKAYSQTREYAPGAACKFCKAKAVCKARAEGLLGSIGKILQGGEKRGKRDGKR